MADAMAPTDEPPFVYSLRRIAPESAWVQEFALGPDDGALITLIRAAIESRHVLPAGLFDNPCERLLIDFLCGDPLDFNDHVTMLTKHKPSLWILRGRSVPTAKVPLVGLTQKAFEALVYLARLRLATNSSGATERLDGALLFSIGFSISHIEKNTIPF
jgi:hypothetical protein